LSGNTPLPAAAAAPAPPPDPNTVTITLGTMQLAGWLNVRVTRGIERFPSDFDLVATELYPSSLTSIDIKPGTPCVLSLGADPVITGYIDSYAPAITAQAHEVRVSGRSTCEDLVDCSCLLQTVQFNNLTLVQLATQLISPFGVTVSAPDGDTGTLPQFDIIVTETPYEVIERAARAYAKLVYDDTSGNLVLAAVGDNAMASGFSEGVNVQEAHGEFSTVERMTTIAAILQTTDVLTNDTSNLPLPYVGDGAFATDKTLPARADGMARYRPLLILAEQDLLQNELMAQRIQWEMARRVGRSQAITITCDSWRDSGGTLWTPNWLAPIYLPSLKVQDVWLITEVTFLRDEQGTRAEVTLMPPAAFQVEPAVLQPFFYQIGMASQPDGTGSSSVPASGSS
jgi:prophage tail gpP-like protein